MTLVALVVDVMTVVPEPAWGEGQRWTVWSTWQPSALEFLLVMTAVYAVLLLRRRWPLPVLVGISALALAFAQAESPSVPVVGVLVCLYTAATLVRQRWQAYLALGVALVAQVAAVELLIGHRDPDMVVALLIVFGLSLSMWTFGRRENEAVRAAAALPGQFAEHGAKAAEDERRRIARELHDIVAHSVSAMVLQAAGGRAVMSRLRQEVPDDPRLETVGRALATIENTGSQSMRELHRLLSVLREDEEAAADCEGEPSSQPGIGDIDVLLELARQSGLVVEVHSTGETVRLDPSVGLAAYRVVQETLTNAMKHGGRGAIVDVFITWQEDCLRLQVRCRGGHDGARPDAMSGGRGLHGLRERVGLIGGTFEAGWVGDEFVATVALPLTTMTRPDQAEPAPADGSPTASDTQARGVPRLAWRSGPREAALRPDRRLIP